MDYDQLKAPRQAREHGQYYKRKVKALAYLGGKCEGCGETDPHALGFIHVDPDSKAFPISTNLTRKGWAELHPELDKCQVLCSSCEGHHRQHARNTRRMQDILRDTVD